MNFLTEELGCALESVRVDGNHASVSEDTYRAARYVRHPTYRMRVSATAQGR